MANLGMYPVKTISASDIFRGELSGVSFKTLTDNTSAVIFHQFFSQDEVKQMITTIYSLRDHWLPNYGGEQFSLGRVWYTHIDDLVEDEYFTKASESKQMIETYFPELYTKILRFCTAIQGTEPVVLRDGWAGPGFVIFPAHERCAQIGGDIHYDWEGLTDGQLDTPNSEAYSFISMVQKPESGGGLKVWNIKYDLANKQGELDPKISEPDEPATLIDYQVGDLVLINSFNLHQIQQFEGDIDRVCLTFHIAKRHDSWHIWF